LPAIEAVLATDDHLWRYWVLDLLVKTPALVSSLRPTLTRLAEQPTAAESAEALDQLAAALLRRHPR